MFRRDAQGKAISLSEGDSYKQTSNLLGVLIKPVYASFLAAFQQHFLTAELLASVNMQAADFLLSVHCYQGGDFELLSPFVGPEFS
jgi:hypothetical protein